MGYSNTIGGFSRAAHLIRKIRVENDRAGIKTLFLHAGDMLTGTPFSIAFRGEMGVDLFNRMQLNAMTVGNHEFDYGKEHLLTYIAPKAAFPLLSANITDDSGKPVFPKSWIDDTIPQQRVVVFGLTTSDTPITTHPSNVKGLQFSPTNFVAREFLEGVRPKDFVVALTHQGIKADEDLARLCPKIDLVIGGHSHTAIHRIVQVGNTWIAQAGAYSKYVGRIDLEIEDGIIKSARNELILLDETIPEDREIGDLVSNYKNKLETRFNEVIGRTEVLLAGGRAAVRSDETTNLGRLVAFLTANAANADIGLVNGGSIRSSIQPGRITLGDVYTSLPFNNKVVGMIVNGADLEKILDYSMNLSPGSGGKLQVWGLETAEQSGLVKILSVQGKVFDPGKPYRIAINDFMSAGGDGYSFLKEMGRENVDYGYVVTDLLAQYIKDNKLITDRLLKNMYVTR
jgi:2',3'-cyclic-nucleotide 2'-phosphodiesterase (5'-nucleotidase family)